MSADLFAPKMDDEIKPAPCGFLPLGGWPHKWARDGHRDSCSRCAGVESAQNIERESRFDFPLPGDSARLRAAILWLMQDGKRRSVVEIQSALSTRKEISARIRELRTGKFGKAWPFNEPRKEGPDPDGVFRYVLRLGDKS